MESRLYTDDQLRQAADASFAAALLVACLLQSSELPITHYRRKLDLHNLL
jgi:hypothetical protein